MASLQEQKTLDHDHMGEGATACPYIWTWGILVLSNGDIWLLGREVACWFSVYQECINEVVCSDGVLNDILLRWAFNLETLDWNSIELGIWIEYVYLMEWQVDGLAWSVITTLEWDYFYKSDLYAKLNVCLSWSTFKSLHGRERDRQVRQQYH